MTFGVQTSSTNPGPAVTSTSTETITPKSSGGYLTGQSITDLIAFYGANPLAQQLPTVDLLTQLVNLGLVAAGTELPAAGAAIAVGSTMAATDQSNYKTYLLNTASGSVLTLPPATGSGIVINTVTTVIVTSNSHKVKAASTADFLTGIIHTNDGATVTGYSSNLTTNHEVNLNGTTTGGAGIGEWMQFTDVAANLWAVQGNTTSTGTAATPFSSSDT